MTMYDGRTKLSQEVYAEACKHYKKKMFKTQIPRNIRLSECPSFGQTIFEYDPKSPGALAYQNMAKEVIKRFFSGSSKKWVCSRNCKVGFEAPEIERFRTRN